MPMSEDDEPTSAVAAASNVGITAGGTGAAEAAEEEAELPPLCEPSTVIAAQPWLSLTTKKLRQQPP